MTDQETKYDAVIVGAGVSGLFMFYKESSGFLAPLLPLTPNDY